MSEYKRYYLADSKITVGDDNNLQGEFRIAGRLLPGVKVGGNYFEVIEIQALHDLQAKYDKLLNEYNSLKQIATVQKHKDIHGNGDEG